MRTAPIAGISTGHSRSRRERCDHYLPRLVGNAEASNTSDTAPSLPRGELRQVILVVEDEPAMRQLSVDALPELGYRAIEADSAAAALRMLDAHPEIVLLFSDVVTPGNWVAPDVY